MQSIAEAIRCDACGSDSFLKRTPQYTGFRKSGEALSCAACGHRFATEAEVSFRERQTPTVFKASDRPMTPKIFNSNEAGRCCRYCEHYVVNPFVQRCALQHREVEATDGCDRFAKRPDPDAATPP